MHNILTVIKKELKRFFGDKRMLVALFFPGILIYVLYSTMGSVMGNVMGPSEDYVYTISINVENELYTDSAFNALTGVVDYTKKVVSSDEEGLELLSSGNADLYVSYTAGVSGGLATYNVYFNSVEMESANIFQIYQAILTANNYTPVINFVSSDVSTEEDMSKMMYSMVVPLLLIMFMFVGAMSVAPESIAGEKERGTIATLLVTPVKRSHIALGKIIALSVTALASGLVSFAGVALSLPNLVGGASGGELNVTLSLGFKEYLALLLVICLTVITFTVLLSILSTLAKSVKEATSYASPLMIVVVAAAMIGMFVETESVYLNLIPIYNSVSIVSSVMNLSVEPLAIVFFVISNVVVIVLGILALAKMFDSEKIMFNK
ncbi:MAG: ABC transporter permease [Clostridia bacterium]|nr:ABC transporter permease [Clostridia bacterium]